MAFMPVIARVSDAFVRASEVIAALSFALDLTEGQPMGHSVRSCVIGMHVAREIGVPEEELSGLYYALLMKDAGCSSNASRMMQIMGADDIGAKRDVKTTDWTKIGWETVQYALAHVRTGRSFTERVWGLLQVAIHSGRNAKEVIRIRCERGASIARRMGLPESTATAIHSLDEHWNGVGYPDGLRGTAIPLFSRILSLAQTVEVFHRTYGAPAALQVARERSGRWFDPDLVTAFLSRTQKTEFWDDIENAQLRVLDLEPEETVLGSGEDVLDNICLAFADVIDAKSPFTYRHSAGVAGAAVAIAEALGLSPEDITLVRRAALLHDIGKLSVSNSILDKPGKLSEPEWDIVRDHPRYSYEILKRVPGFGALSEIAASHHEKLDGSGYFRHRYGTELPLTARILVVADMYDALAASRPYRNALPEEEVFRIMQADAPRAIDADCFHALQYSCGSAEAITSDLLRLAGAAESHPTPYSASHSSRNASIG